MPARTAPLLASLALLFGCASAHHKTPAPAAPPAGPLEAGAHAPDFSLFDAREGAPLRPIRLSKLVKDGPVVLIFNMGLGCSACSGELAAFGAKLPELHAAGIQVVAINSADPAETREYFKTALPIPFPILYDRDDATARAYGLVSADGSVDERTFYVDASRQVRHAYRPDEPGGEIPRLIEMAARNK